MDDEMEKIAADALGLDSSTHLDAKTQSKADPFPSPKPPPSPLRPESKATTAPDVETRIVPQSPQKPDTSLGDSVKLNAIIKQLKQSNHELSAIKDILNRHTSYLALIALPVALAVIGLICGFCFIIAQSIGRN